MPAEETVVIHVEIDADLAADRAKIEAFFASLQTRSRAASRDIDKLERRMGGLNKTFGKTGRSTHKVTRSFDKLRLAARKTGEALGQFLSKFSLFSFIGVAIEIGLISAALLGVKLALVSGRLAIQAYQATLVGLGVAAGGVAVAIGSVAAAMRQLSEATLAPEIGGYKRAAQAMRAVMSDQQLSFFGMEGIQTAVTALAQGGVSTDRSYTNILRQLGDYTTDPKQLAELASVYATIDKTGQISGESLGKLGGINQSLVAGISELSGLSGEDLDKALEEGGAGIGSDIFGALLSGQAEATNAWENQLERMNNTVIGTLKGMLPRMFTLFADLGAPFLNTIQQTLTSIEFIIKKTVMRIRGAVTGFGLDSFMPGLLEGFEMLSDWIARLVNESLPKVEGWVEGITNAWDTVRNYFIDMTRILQPLEAGADALLRILGPQFGGLFDGFAKLIRNFSRSLVENEDAFKSFGDAVGRFIEGFLSFFDSANERFVEALPVWSNLLDTLTEDVVPALIDIFDMLHQASMTVLPVVTAALGAIANVLGSIARALSAIMGIPGIGNLLGMPMGMLGLGLGAMMFKTTRKPLVGAAKFGAARLGASGASALAQNAALGLAVSGGVRGGVLGKGMVGAAGMMAAPGAYLAGPGLASGALGYFGGREIGSRVSGAGGQAAGAGAGAIAGAGVGAAFGLMGGPFAPVTVAGGAIVGAFIGGIAGWIGSKGAQDARAAGLEGAKALVDAFHDSLQLMLAKGQNRAALESILDLYDEEFGKTYTDYVDKFGLDRDTLEKYTVALEGRATLEKEVTERMGFLEKNLSHLSRASGVAERDLEHLANVLGLDLTASVGNVLDMMIQLGQVSEYDISIPGIQDTASTLLYENLFGQGSAFEQTYTAPEMQDTLNALMNEAYDITAGGGALSGDLVRNIVESLIAYDQTAYGMFGSDLIEGLMIDMPRIDEKLGTGNLFQEFMEGLVKTQAEMLDPSKNPAIKALWATTMDEVLSFGPEGMTEAQITTETQRKFDEKVDLLKGTRGADFDEKLNELITASRAAVDLAQYVDLSAALGNVIVDFESLHAVLESLIPTPTTDNWLNPGGFGGGGITGTGTRSGGRQRPGGGPTTASQVTSNVQTSTQTMNSEMRIYMDVDGLGLVEAMAFIRSEAAKAARNITQRSNSSGSRPSGGQEYVT